MAGAPANSRTGLETVPWRLNCFQSQCVENATNVRLSGRSKIAQSTSAVEKWSGHRSCVTCKLRFLLSFADTSYEQSDDVLTLNVLGTVALMWARR